MQRCVGMYRARVYKLSIVRRIEVRNAPYKHLFIIIINGLNQELEKLQNRAARIIT